MANQEEIRVGQQFADFASFEKALIRYEKLSGEQFYRPNSKTLQKYHSNGRCIDLIAEGYKAELIFREAIYKCATLKKNQKSKPTNCKALLTLRVKDKQWLIIKKFDRLHDHSMAQTNNNETNDHADGATANGNDVAEIDEQMVTNKEDATAFDKGIAKLLTTLGKDLQQCSQEERSRRFDELSELRKTWKDLESITEPVNNRSVTDKQADDRSLPPDPPQPNFQSQEPGGLKDNAQLQREEHDESEVTSYGVIDDPSLEEEESGPRGTAQLKNITAATLQDDLSDIMLKTDMNSLFHDIDSMKQKIDHTRRQVDNCEYSTEVDENENVSKKQSTNKDDRKSNQKHKEKPKIIKIEKLSVLQTQNIIGPRPCKLQCLKRKIVDSEKIDHIEKAKKSAPDDSLDCGSSKQTAGGLRDCKNVSKSKDDFKDDGAPSPKNSGPTPFVEKTNSEKLEILLGWLRIPKQLQQDVLVRKYKIMKHDLDIDPNTLHDSFIDDGVKVSLLKNFFGTKVFNDFQAALKKKKELHIKSCAVCLKKVMRSGAKCDSCLQWSHLKCVQLKQAPKKADWFCRICIGNP